MAMRVPAWPKVELCPTPAGAVWHPAGPGPRTYPHQLSAGSRIFVGPGVSTVLPDMDFETYSEAGHVWTGEKWTPPKGATKAGLFAVGAAAYAAHPSTEVLSFKYDLKDGRGAQWWRPGLPPPTALFEHIARGGLIEAHNVAFELWIWNLVCTRRYGWPPLLLEQCRDSMAKGRAWALPGALADVGEVLNIDHPKDPEGDRLLRKFSVPRKPTKNKPETRVLPDDEPEEAERLYAYNERDIVAESEVSGRVPDLTGAELKFWQATLRSNSRGVALDVENARACEVILDAALARYHGELAELTGGSVTSASEVQKLTGWLGAHGVKMRSLDETATTEALNRPDLPPPARRALELRQRVASSSVKKLYAMLRQVTGEGRLHDLFIYHRARTGRDGGADVQPQNLPKAGPTLSWCDAVGGCGKPYGQHLNVCPHCGAPEWLSTKDGWSWGATEAALEVIRLGSLDWVEYVFGDALLTISGCIRGLFTAAPGHRLICSDYSSIEAVVTAVLAGEQWRIDAFRRKEDIYYHGAGGVTGWTYEQYKAWEREHGHKHPDRQELGKPGELGLGFGGWISAWRQFDKSGRFTDAEIKQNILKWRDASPMIVELWGGQVRGKPWAPERSELYGLEGAAIAAVMNPGQCYDYRGILWGVKDDCLYCRLPSGRLMAYHRPRLGPSRKWEGQISLSFEGYNTNAKMGPMGWVRFDTYGGRLTENVVQATARDIMRDAVLRLEAAGYPIVLRVHDELVAEVPNGFGSIEEFERLMSQVEPWAEGWPIRASGGWEGMRYRKD